MLKSLLFQVWKQNNAGMGREYAEEIFRDYGKLDVATKDIELTKTASFTAINEILQHWNVILNPSQLNIL
jgi:hypothetical protein